MMSKTKNSSITSFFKSTTQPKPTPTPTPIIIIEEEDEEDQTKSNQLQSSTTSSNHHSFQPQNPKPNNKSKQSNPNTCSTKPTDEDDEIQFISITKPPEPKSNPKPKPKPKSKPNQTFLTFAELEAIRKSKQSSKLIATEASWPTDSLQHNRESYQSYSTHHHLSEIPVHHPLKFKKGKSKPKTRFTEELKLDEITFSEPLFPSNKLPRLERLDLVEPSQLISDLQTNSVYQSPLISRILNFLKPLPHQTSIRFDHPSLQRQHHRSSASSSLLWTQKYAPKSSLEVLGEQNLKNVQILKAWLKEIALKEADSQDPSVSQQSKTSHGKKSKRSSNHSNKTGSQKRTITRKVDRKSKRRRMNDEDEDDIRDFIVESDDEDSDTIYAKDVDVLDFEEDQSEEEISMNKSPRKRIGSFKFGSTSIETINTPEKIEEPKIEFENLTNLMLLTGPTGIGKTSSVYALANEIGWDVFELNSGVLRNRKEIERLVGDVARNHVLPNSSNHQPIKSTTKKKVENPKGKLGNLFSEMMKGEKGKKDPIETKENDSNSSMVEEVEIKLNGTTKQTLILLEEVDVVYQQDKEFWLGVIQLISQSMRPVIMTCNDRNVLPTESLPIQDCLEFTSPSIEEATGLMKVICLNEGHLIDHRTLQSFYSSEHQYRKPIEMGIESEMEGMDLRRSLNMLQFWCQWAIGCKMGGVSWLDLKSDKESKMLFSSNSLPISRIEQDLSEMSVEERIKEMDKKDYQGLQGLWDGLDLFEKTVKGLEIRSFVDGFIDKREKVQIQNFEWDLNVDETDEIVLPNLTKWLEKDEFNEFCYRESLASDDQERMNAIQIRMKLIGILDEFDERKFQIER
ncbi:uncharacterized protein MELLADRAFT_93952 [Melampsora larici-populina 98AG31]|uniref:ATPase AAA-type core domain-containing protein n=1 Tax=Melampsora larici-populina (strain 98AG31 / pathotype 3-4-7) TaxID=747676 RepID=F4S5V8_MELLP|nr:uncharacterized protein MELLADRAFT_93952 [Melampsora larici-populina 98AG31]EGF99998.1 hypothetical protein MELLADRAFT_93952 [Melampsora larici-populina 98AG31]